MAIEYKGYLAYFVVPTSPELDRYYKKYVTAGKPFEIIQYALLKKMINEDVDYFIVPEKNNRSGYNLKFQFDRIDYGHPNEYSSLTTLCFKFKNIEFIP